MSQADVLFVAGGITSGSSDGIVQLEELRRHETEERSRSAMVFNRIDASWSYLPKYVVRFPKEDKLTFEST